MLIYIVRAMDDFRRCLAVYDEFECSVYLNRTYGTWFIRLGNDEANAILNEASRVCTQMEGSFLYCIFCVGSQCNMEPSGSTVKYIIECLDKLGIRQDVKDALRNMLNKAVEVNTEIACSGE